MPTVAAPAPPRSKRLRLDAKRGWIGGVCAGLADFFDLDPRDVRIAYVLVSVLTAFAGVLVYLVLWAIIPVKERAPEGAEEPPRPAVDAA